jgi:hypothetical protein
LALSLRITLSTASRHDVPSLEIFQQWTNPSLLLLKQHRESTTTTKDTLTFVSPTEYLGRASPYPIVEENIAMIGAIAPSLPISPIV